MRTDGNSLLPQPEPLTLDHTVPLVVALMECADCVFYIDICPLRKRGASSAEIIKAIERRMIHWVLDAEATVAATRPLKAPRRRAAVNAVREAYGLPAFCGAQNMSTAQDVIRWLNAGKLPEDTEAYLNRHMLDIGYFSVNDVASLDMCVQGIKARHARARAVK